MSSFPRPMRWLVLASLLCLLSGCGSYMSSVEKVRSRVLNGDLEGALDELKEDDGDVLRLMERGLLLAYAGRHEESNASFAAADQLIEELYTKSISREAAAFLTNDATLPYRGYAHEQVMLHLYSAFNYLALGDGDAALVECRRAELRLQQLEDMREEESGYRYDAFAEYLAGILHAQDDDGNAAMVSSRRALLAFEEAGREVPEQIAQDCIDWAQRFGFSEEARELRERYPEAASRLEPPRQDEGELLLVYESGFVSRLVENRIDLPILNSDGGSTDEIGLRVRGRSPRGQYIVPEGDEIAYWLSIALPEMVHEPPLWTSARMRSTDGRSASTFLVSDLSAKARLLFDEGSGKRVLRTIVRALAKYTAHKQAEKESKGWGLLVDVLGSVTERADTRSWSMLPDSIHMARMRLPEGTHRVVVEVLDRGGEVAQTATFEEVEITAGFVTLIQHRSYP